MRLIWKATFFDEMLLFWTIFQTHLARIYAFVIYMRLLYLCVCYIYAFVISMRLLYLWVCYIYAFVISMRFLFVLFPYVRSCMCIIFGYTFMFMCILYTYPVEMPLEFRNMKKLSEFWLKKNEYVLVVFKVLNKHNSLICIFIA